MTTEKTTLAQEIEDSMACSAYAEAGEPCPIGTAGKKDDTGAAAGKTVKVRKSFSRSIEDTMACTAYAEAGEPCPLW